MRYHYPLPPQIDYDNLHATLLPVFGPLGFSGLTPDHAGGFHVEFPDAAPLSDGDKARLDAAIASYVYAPSWAPVRDERTIRLAVHDAHMAKAQRALRKAMAADDQAGIAAANTAIATLDVYGQALADITKGANPANPAWPTPPWEATT